LTDYNENPRTLEELNEFANNRKWQYAKDLNKRVTKVTEHKLQEEIDTRIAEQLKYRTYSTNEINSTVKTLYSTLYDLISKNKEDVIELKNQVWQLHEDSSTKDKLIKNLQNQMGEIQSENYAKSLTIDALKNLLPLLLNQHLNAKNSNNTTYNLPALKNEEIEQIKSIILELVEKVEKEVKFNKSMNKLLDDAKDDAHVL